MTPMDQDPQQDEHYDLVVVGGGSGNSIVDDRFADQRVLLVDDGAHFGGTCLNAGCIPTKMLVHVADVAAEARDGAALGIRASVEAVDWPAISARVFGRIDAISEGGREWRESGSENVTLLRESVGFEAPGVLVSASGQRITADRIVLAAGSRPRPLPAVYAPDPDIHDSDSIMRIAALPASLLIVGGGYVAAEFAHVFSHLGVHVTQVARSAHLLGNLDQDVSTRFTTLARTQWDVITDCEVEEIERDGDVLRSRLASGHLVETEAVLVALGRVPNTDTLAVANAGYDLHEDGRIVVDAQQRVLADGEPVPGVFALGDISSDHQLKHVANHQARVVQHNLLHPDDLVGGAPGPVPQAVFSRPQIGSFGLTEAEARKAGPVVAIEQPYSSTAWGWALEDTTSFCKLVVDPRDGGTILGAHIIGSDSAALIQPLLTAASLGHRVTGLARAQYWPHPAVTEVVENALLSAESAVADWARENGGGVAPEGAGRS
ncbi:Mycothione reductase [Clavibacter michiganensis]|nr:Mycothione reductase [Clavibacter michiganensis]